MDRVSRRIPTMKTGAKLMLTERGEIPETGLSKQEIMDFVSTPMENVVTPVDTRDVTLSQLDRYTDINALIMPPPPIRPPRPSTVNRPFQPINRPPPPPIDVEALNEADIINLLGDDDDDDAPEDLREPLADLMPELLERQ